MSQQFIVAALSIGLEGLIWGVKLFIAVFVVLLGLAAVKAIAES